jgi:hypothetical protein
MNPTNHASGAMLVPDPEGQEFESGHSQFRNRKAGVSAKSATDIVDLAVAELGDGLSVLKKLVVKEGGGYLVREAKDISKPFNKMGSIVCVPGHRERCRGVGQWGRCELNREVVGSIVASLAIVVSPLVKRGSRMGLYKLERYSHEGYLIKVVVLAVAGRSLDMVEPNPIHGLIIIMI